MGRAWELVSERPQSPGHCGKRDWIPMSLGWNPASTDFLPGGSWAGHLLEPPYKMATTLGAWEEPAEWSPRGPGKGFGKSRERWSQNVGRCVT